MNQIPIFSFLQLFLCFYASLADDSVCGDWEQFDNEKCIKLIDKVGILSCKDAKEICDIQQDSSSGLVSIESLKEKEFIRKLINNNKMVADTVWTRYTEFSLPEMVGSITDNTDKTCATLISGDDLNIKWADDEPHDRNNSVICQKMQNWSHSRIRSLLQSQKELNESLTIAMNEIKYVKQNPVPIGFIYVQLPEQPHPNTIWPKILWADVSSDYAKVKPIYNYPCSERHIPRQYIRPPVLPNPYIRPPVFPRPDLPNCFGKHSDFILINSKTQSNEIAIDPPVFHKRNTIKENDNTNLLYKMLPQIKKPVNKTFDIETVRVWKRVK